MTDFQAYVTGLLAGDLMRYGLRVESFKDDDGHYLPFFHVLGESGTMLVVEVSQA